MFYIFKDNLFIYKQNYNGLILIIQYLNRLLPYKLGREAHEKYYSHASWNVLY